MRGSPLRHAISRAIQYHPGTKRPAFQGPEQSTLNIAFVSSEVVPFAKTGGLADVVEALPRELEKLGHHPVVFMPAYRQTHDCGLSIEPTDIEVSVTIGSKVVGGRLLVSHLPNSRVPVYMLKQDSYFDRPELYRENGGVLCRWETIILPPNVACKAFRSTPNWVLILQTTAYSLLRASRVYTNGNAVPVVPLV